MIVLHSLESVSGLLPGPDPRVLGTIWRANVRVDGRFVSVKMYQTAEPTDDEIIVAIKAEINDPGDGRVLRSGTVADRIEEVARLAQARQAIIACAADTAFTAQERSRLSNMADLISQRIKSYV